MHLKYAFKFSSQLERLEACLFEKNKKKTQQHQVSWDLKYKCNTASTPASKPYMKTRTVKPAGMTRAWREEHLGHVTALTPESGTPDSLTLHCKPAMLLLETERHVSYCSQTAVTSPHCAI